MFTTGTTFSNVVWQNVFRYINIHGFWHSDTTENHLKKIIQTRMTIINAANVDSLLCDSTMQSPLHALFNLILRLLRGVNTVNLMS